MEFIVKTFGGLEDVLAKELRELGAKDIKPVKRAVLCSGTLEDVFKFNYQLRTAVKVLIKIKGFEIKDKEDLYQKAKTIEWQDFFSQHDSFCIDSVMYSELFKHSNYPALVVKDAIVDYFKHKYYKRPHVNTDKPNARINLHISNKSVTIALDTSGQALFIRGYRDYTNEAPLNEVMAAGLIMLSGWDKETDLLDPMCGSGTILLEAAMMHQGIPAGYKRDHFAFMDWPSFKSKQWKAFKDSIDWKKQASIRIEGRDLSAKTVKLIASANARNAGLSQSIKVVKKDFMKSEEENHSWHIVTNPPYDKILTLEDDLKFYEDLGTVLKFKFKGSSATVISSNAEAIKRIGLKPDQKQEIDNVKLNYKVYNFSINA